jgi:hypothetical protein
MIVRIVMLLVICNTLAGCAGSNAARMGQRHDVFQVVKEGAAVGADEVLVTISALIKTHNKESGVLFETAKHGSDNYLLVVDINGQSLSMPFQTVEETTGTDPQADPESGSGVRYSYKATVRLRPGRYTVTACLPTENVLTSQDVQISAGSSKIIVKPLYRGLAGRKPASLRWVPTFRDGVRGLMIVMN